MATIDVTVNTESYRVDVRDHWTLLDLLRDGLALTGTKDGCGEGVCGACSVLVNGRLVRACLTLARRVHGATITTIEGLDAGGVMTDMQRAFIEQGAVQCGFCTPGMLVAIKALVEAHPEPSEHDIREFLSGNLCRCTGYARIVAAIQSVVGVRESDARAGGDRA